jgi:hypothetical protein
MCRVSQLLTADFDNQNIYAESVFVCPSYWLASAYTKAPQASYVFQYSVPFASHGADLAAALLTPGDNLSPDFLLAFRRSYGAFIQTGNPSIGAEIAAGATTGTVKAGSVWNWPAWSDVRGQSVAANWNQTGGEPYQVDFQGRANVTQYKGASLRNNITFFDPWTWEGGRLARCAWWEKIGAAVPE